MRGRLLRQDALDDRTVIPNHNMNLCSLCVQQWLARQQYGPGSTRHFSFLKVRSKVANPIPSDNSAGGKKNTAHYGGISEIFPGTAVDASFRIVEEHPPERVRSGRESRRVYAEPDCVLAPRKFRRGSVDGRRVRRNRCRGFETEHLGVLIGSGSSEYQQSGENQDHRMPAHNSGSFHEITSCELRQAKPIS
jgi:hypothetical protein